MSESVTEKETTPSFSQQSQETQEFKWQMTPLIDFNGQSDEALKRIAAEASLSRMKESASRLRSRLSSGRRIF